MNATAFIAGMMFFIAYFVVKISWSLSKIVKLLEEKRDA